ncbi:YecA family protein [Bacillus manliponensis]|uniref:YecA family protein n=1 Tax=Bacillus manliponensis TaxID=574376 RepID=UPI003517862B
MSTFLEKIYPFLNSEDKVIRRFVLQILDEQYKGKEEELLHILETNNLTLSVVAKFKKYPVSEKGIEKIINIMDTANDDIVQRELFSIILENADGKVLEAYKEELLKLKSFIQKQKLQLYIDWHYATTEELFSILGNHVIQLENEDYYNQQQFDLGARLVRELASREDLDEQQICSIIEEEMQKEWMNYKGIYYVMLAGERGIQQAVPMLAELIARPFEESLLVEIVSEALKKIGGDFVVEHVKEYMYNPEAEFFVVSVIGSVHTPYAEEVLLEALLQMENVSMKTVLASELCSQLSIKAIPHVAALVKEGYDEGLLELDEYIYANCKINNIEHPDILLWKKRIQDREEAHKNRYMGLENIFNQRPVLKKESIGRNDPCTCGSGRKYKKCCLKTDM